MADKNIQMKQKNGTGWDSLFPKTKANLVYLNSGKTVEVAITEILTLIGAGGNGGVSLIDVQNEIKKVVGSAPAALDTLQELSTALNNDSSFSTTITNALTNKVDKITGKGLSTEDFTTALKIKLDGLVNYSHPTGDGNLHVPITGTTNNGKVLKAGATAGSISWGTVSFSEILSKPTSLIGYGITDVYNKTQIDTMNTNVVKLSVSATEPTGVDFWFAEI